MPPHNQTTAPNNKLWLLGFFLSLLSLFFTLSYGLDIFLSYIERIFTIDSYPLTVFIIEIIFYFFISLLICSILYAKSISNSAPQIRLIPVIILFIIIKYFLLYIYLKPYRSEYYDEVLFYSFLLGIFILPFITATVFDKNKFKLSTSIKMLFFVLLTILLDSLIDFCITLFKYNDPTFILVELDLIYTLPLAIVITISLNQWLYSKIQPFALKLHQGIMAKVMYTFQVVTALLATLILLSIIF